MAKALKGAEKKRNSSKSSWSKATAWAETRFCPSGSPPALVGVCAARGDAGKRCTKKPMSPQRKRAKTKEKGGQRLTVIVDPSTEGAMKYSQKRSKKTEEVTFDQTAHLFTKIHITRRGEGGGERKKEKERSTAKKETQRGKERQLVANRRRT